MGLLSVDPMELEIYLNAGGSAEQTSQAARVWPLVQQHHRLLVTLLLINAAANEALPIFLNRYAPFNVTQRNVTMLCNV
jgi:metal transporter CNNM